MTTDDADELAAINDEAELLELVRQKSLRSAARMEKRRHAGRWREEHKVEALRYGLQVSAEQAAKQRMLEREECRC